MESENFQDLFFGTLGILVMFLLAVFIGCFLVAYFFKRQKAIAEMQKNELKKQFSQTLLQSQLEIKEQTLKYISSELHDNLGQIASLIKINLNTIRLAEIAKAAEKIDVTKELTRKLITDLKSLSVSLGANGITQVGLVKALEKEVEYLNKSGQFTVSFIQEGSLHLIDNDKTIILFRMSQEILNNIIKHSNAEHITVSINTFGNLFKLAFYDDGVGFDIENAKNSNGAGLLNLQKRATLINAQVNFQSVPGNGTTVVIELPL